VTQLPAIDPSIETAEFEDEMVVLVPARRRAVRLPPGPALVFDSCRRGHRFDELLSEIGDEIAPGDAGSVQTWIESTLVELARQGIVEPMDQGVSERADS